MEKFKLESLSKVLTFFIGFTLILGVLVTLSLPYMLKMYFTTYDFVTYLPEITDWNHYYAVLFTLGPSGVCACVLLWQLLKILKSASKQNPFVAQNVTCFLVMSVCCLLIAILFTILSVLYPTAFTFALAYTFYVLWLACLVFGKLFHKAVEYKSENDLTV